MVTHEDGIRGLHLLMEKGFKGYIYLSDYPSRDRQGADLMITHEMGFTGYIY
jgi:hypothetical protein